MIQSTLYCQARIEKKKKKDRSSFKQCKVAADPGQVAHPVNILPHCFTLFFAKFKLPETTNCCLRGKYSKNKIVEMCEKK